MKNLQKQESDNIKEDNSNRYGNQEDSLSDFSVKARKLAKDIGVFAGIGYLFAAPAAFTIHVASSVAVGAVWFTDAIAKATHGHFIQAAKMLVRGAVEATVIFFDVAIAIVNLPIRVFTGHYISSIIGDTSNRIIDAADKAMNKTGKVVNDGRKKLGYWTSYVLARENRGNEAISNDETHNKKIGENNDNMKAKESQTSHHEKIDNERLSKAIDAVLGEEKLAKA